MKCFKLILGFFLAIALCVPAQAQWSPASARFNGAGLRSYVVGGGGGSPVPVIANEDTIFSAANSTQVNFNKPTGLAVGDLMVARMLVAGSASMTPTLPSGWAIPSGASTTYAAAFAQQTYLAYRVADSGDVAATTFTFDTTGATQYGAQGIISRITGAHTTTPINGTPTNQSTTTGTTGTFPSVTTSVANALVLLSGGLAYGSSPAPSGSEFPNVVPSGTTASTNTVDNVNFVYIGNAYYTQATAGATGTKTVAVRSLSSSAGILQAITVAISPP